MGDVRYLFVLEWVGYMAWDHVHAIREEMGEENASVLCARDEGRFLRGDEDDSVERASAALNMFEDHALGAVFSGISHDGRDRRGVRIWS